MTWKLMMDLGARKAGKKKIFCFQQMTLELEELPPGTRRQWQMTLLGEKKTITTKMTQTNPKGFLEWFYKLYSRHL